MIKSTFDKYIRRSYVQKSEIFLFPQVYPGYRKEAPLIGTYLSCKELKITEFDCKLITYCKKGNTPSYKLFENKMLNNKKFLNFTENNQHIIYIMDFEKEVNDWFLFLEGRYSKMSSSFKINILKHFSRSKSDTLMINSYLYPDKYRDYYLEHLADDKDRPVLSKILKKVGELTDPPNIKKETLILNEEYGKINVGV